MEVTVTIKSADLTRYELLSLLQAIRDCEQTNFRQKLLGIAVGTEPQMSQDELLELLAQIRPSLALIQMPVEKPRVVHLGSRLISLGSNVVGTCDDMSFTIAEATDKEIEDLQNARVISLVRAGKG